MERLLGGMSGVFSVIFLINMYLFFKIGCIFCRSIQETKFLAFFDIKRKKKRISLNMIKKSLLQHKKYIIFVKITLNFPKLLKILMC